MSEQQILNPDEAQGPTYDAPADLSIWRVQVLNGMLYAAAALGLPAIISGSVTAIRDGQLTRILVFGIAYSFVLLLAFVRNRLPFNFRAAGFILIAFILGLDSLRSTGLAGSGRVFLMAMTIIGTYLFGLRGGLLTLGLSILSTIGIGWGMSGGAIPITPEVMASTDARSWLTGGVVFTLLSSVLVISLAILQRGLEDALSHQQELVDTLAGQQELLERRVAERTSELRRQSMQLEATAEIARLATESDDVDELMSRAIEVIRSRFGFYHASIFLLDETDSWAEIVASTGEAGQRLLSRRHRLAVGSASIIGWVTANKLPRVSADVSQDPFYFPNPALPDTRSEMAVPLMVGTRLTGALDLQSTENNAFADANVRAIEAIAGELAFAIENARLTTERQTQLVALEGEVQERIRQSWSDFARSSSPSIIHIGSGASGASSGGFTGFQDMSMRGETYLSQDGKEVVVPVRVRGETIAAIAARRAEGEEAWSNDEVALMESVAGQAALALETARQYAEEQRRVSELEVVNRVSQAASQLLRTDTLLRMVGRQVQVVLGGTDVALALLDGSGEQLDFAYALRGGEETELPSKPATEGLEGVVFRSRQPLLLADAVARRAAELGVPLGENAPKSWLGVPMMVGDQLVGLIVTQDSNRPGRFNDDDLALLSTIAGQMATALQNARLLEQVQRTARRERMIHEISSKVRQSPDIESVLETTAREVGRALNAARATVRLGHPSEDEQRRAEAAREVEKGESSE
jgi:GAF domain-containing protein